LSKSLTPIQQERTAREGGVKECRNLLDSCRRSACLTATGSAEKVELGLEKSILSGLFEYGSSQMRSRKEFAPSVGTFDKCQSSSDRMSASVGILADSRTDLAEPGISMLSRFESQIEWPTAIRAWQTHDLASNHAPTLARVASRSGLLQFWAEAKPRFMTSPSSGFALAEFGIFLAQSSADNADGSHERRTASCKPGPEVICHGHRRQVPH
jgi:hypothetical protein